MERIQGLVAHEVILKYTPQLKFVADESVEKATRVLAIIDEIEKIHPTDEVPPEDH